MRLHIHDFSGHPFQVQLSRKLAERGDHVWHSFCDQYVSGRGTMSRVPGDPETLAIDPVRGRRRFAKYDAARRTLFEIAYARDLWKVFTTGPLDAVVLCNAPLITTYILKVALRRRRLPWVFWHQDIYWMGMRDELARRFSAPIARGLSSVFAAMERACVRDASAVVAINDVFRQQYRDWGLDVGHVTVVPNWAPLDSIAPVERNNAWSREMRLPEAGLRVLYSGTLGRKHNPNLLIDLLRCLVDAGADPHLTVVSEGDGVEQIRSAVENDDRITVLPFQPADRLAEVLSSADVLVGLLEPEASQFSVPSKVLSYLAAGRPIVGLMPDDNAAAEAIRATGSFTGRPDRDGVEQAADWVARLTQNPDECRTLGRASRAYAEREFDADSVTERFRDLLSAAQAPSSALPAHERDR